MSAAASARLLGPCLVVSLLAACASGSSSGPPPVVGMVRHLDGTSTSLAALRGKPAVLFVLTTWSAPALVDLPRLAALQQKHRDRLAVLVVALDEQPAAVAVFAETFAPPFPVVVPADRPRFVGPDGPIGPITLLPATALVTSEGALFGRVDGVWPPGALEEAIDRLLAADPASR